jgi:peptidoglycan-N-acetylglucosamine deacetylase
MKPFFAKSPKLIQALFSDYTWRIATDIREIYLTFDDGPHPDITPWVLKILADYNAKATFFCVGENMVKYPEIYSQIIQQKHSIGNHTFNHINGWKTNNNTYFDNIYKTEEIIKKKEREKRKEKKEGESYPSDPTTNNRQATTKLFRPPYGKIKSSQSKILIKNGFKIIMWDVLSGDFDINIPKEKCFQNVINHVQKGSIVVFHDSEKAFKNLEFALPKTLEYFSENGYTFKAL